MAANWQQYEAKKHLYPNLRYTCSRAAVPDTDHLAYVGINRPIDDPFWDAHYPPNRWRCLCGVEPNDDDANGIPDKLPPPAKDFNFNSGKLQQVFDVSASGYAAGVSKNDATKLAAMGIALVALDSAGEAGYETVYASKSNTVVDAHPLSKAASDYPANLSMARELANSKLPLKKIEILPNLVDYPELREQLLPDAKGLSNPDFRIDGVICDMKTPSEPTAGRNTIKTMMKNANGQGNGIVLYLPTGYITDELLYNNINEKMSNKAFSNFQIYLHHKGEWTHFTKQSWKEFYKEFVAK